MDHPDDAWIGTLIADPVRQADWRAFVAALHEAARAGGPLEGWLFHGTSASRARKIAREGVITSESLARADGMTGHEDWFWTAGTHWGHPKVAAFYAEDLIESSGRSKLDLAIVAVPLSELEASGPFSADGQSIDCPLYTRLGRTQAETDALWDSSKQDSQASLAVLGSLLVLGPVGPEALRVLRSAADVEDLVREASAPVPGR